MPCIRCKLLLEMGVQRADMRRFGIEFAPEVVQADGNARNLAWRICNAKKILVSAGTDFT